MKTREHAKNKNNKKHTRKSDHKNKSTRTESRHDTNTRNTQQAPTRDREQKNWYSIAWDYLARKTVAEEKRVEQGSEGLSKKYHNKKKPKNRTKTTNKTTSQHKQKCKDKDIQQTNQTQKQT